VAKHNSGRRAHSRKRRPNPRGASSAAARGGPPAGASRRDVNVGAPAGVQPADARPRAPWHPLPLSELLIFVGAIGAVVAYLKGIEGNGVLLAAGIGAVVIGTVEVTLREHLGGFRSHTLMLAVIPAIVLHSAAVLVVVAVRGSAPRWLSLALLPIDVAVVVVCFRLLRARYLDAHHRRTFAGLR
jgi:hypothetical protein